MASELPENPEKAPTRDPNARLRELLAIPERQRTDAQWDEIIEIEISQGPKKPSGNSASPGAQDGKRQQQPKRPANKPAMPGKHIRKHRPNSGG
jgi:hypothetical protein